MENREQLWQWSLFVVSIFYGSTFLHRSQLLYIINRASSVRSRHPIPTHPSTHPLLSAEFFSFPSLHAANRICDGELNGFRSNLETPREAGPPWLRLTPTHNLRRGGWKEGERERKRKRHRLPSKREIIGGGHFYGT